MTELDKTSEYDKINNQIPNVTQQNCFNKIFSNFLNKQLQEAIKFKTKVSLLPLLDVIQNKRRHFVLKMVHDTITCEYI